MSTLIAVLDRSVARLLTARKHGVTFVTPTLRVIMSIGTTLKLPESLKARVQALASEAGQTPHAFMLNAIEEQATAAELRRGFVASALLAEQEVAKYGKVYSLDEMSRYLKAKVAGSKPKPPRTRKAG